MNRTKSTLRRSLAVVMSLLMLMTAWVFVAPETLPQASAAVTQQSDLPTFTFYVPETIYLDPSDNKTFKYYVDRAQSVNGSLTASNGDTSAWYYFKCDTATSVTSLTCGASNPTLSKTSSTNGELKGVISAGALSSAISMNATALIPWTVTFTTDKGTFSATAYSVAYAPNRNVTANGATGYSGNNYNRAYASGLIYIQGAQTTAASTMSSIDSFHSADSYNYQNIDGRMLDPLVNGVAQPDDNQPAGYSRSSSPFTNATNSFASCNCVASEDYGNNDDWTGHIVCNKTPAEVIVDTSRYSNTSQLPNLKLGYIVTDYQNTDSRRHSYVSNCTSKVSNPNNLSSATFVVDSTDILKHSYWRSDSKMKKIYGSDQNTYGTVLWESSGNSVPQLGGDAPGSNIDGSTDDIGKKYLEPISVAVSGSGATTIHYFRGCASGLYKSSYAISCAMVLLKVTTVTKADLRTLINNCVGTYINPYYTGSRWNTYSTALQNACSVLGNPAATQSQIDTAKNNLQSAANNLKFAIPLTLDQDSVGTLPAGGEVWFSFTPSTTKSYIFFTHADYDTQYELYEDAATSASRDQDDGDYYTRQLLGLGYQVYDEMSLTAGTVYYFKVDAYSASSSGDTPVRVATPVKVTFNATGGTSKEYNLPKGYDTLKLDKTNVSRTGHTLVGWSTSGTGEESLYKLASATITVPTSAKTYYALWAPNSPTELTLDSTNTVTISAPSEIQYFAYTPEKTRDYLIYSISSSVVEGTSNSNPDPYVLIYESDTYRANGTNIGADDDGGNSHHDFVGTYNRNFFIRTELTAGTTYLIGAKAYHGSTDNNGNVPTGSYELHFEGVYKIDYDANGGENAPTVEHEKFYNRSITLSEDEPTRAHYHFLGWATTDDATEPEYQPGDTCNINDDATLYAVWEIDQYDVTLNTAEDGGYTVSTEPAAKVNHGDDVTFSITLDEGYTDSAAPTCTATNAGTVTSSKDGDVITYTVPNVTGNTTITLGDADINTYTIVWKNWDGTELETDENVPYGATPSYDGEAPTREDDAQYHYTTYSWDPMVGVVTGNKTYTAQFSWEIKSYTVTFYDKDGNMIGFPQDVSYGEDATPPADDPDDYSDADNHYTFTGWTNYTNIQANTDVMPVFASEAHTFDQEVATADYKASDADCTHAATYYYSCTCGYKGAETFTSGDPLGHTMTPHAAEAGTDCKHYGTVAYYHCSVCEKNFDDEVGTNELTDLSDNTYGAHQLGALTPAVPASNCQTTGTVAYYTCGVCGTLFAADGTTVLTSTDDSTPGPHAFNDLQYDSTHHWYKCANCDAIDGKTTHAGTAATCMAKSVCDVCHQEYGEKDSTNHTGNNTTTQEDVVAATCMAKGSYTEVVTCECGAELSRTPGKEIAIDSTNHTGNNTTTQEDVVPATCMAKGSYTEVVTCECGAELSRTPGKEIAIDSTNHTGNNSTSRADVVDATCMAPGSYTEVVTCECGAELSRTPGKVIEIDPDNHSLTYVPAQAAADCTVTGTVEHWNCALCGKDFADAEGTTQITDLSDGVYGAHDYNIAGASFAWVENGEGGWDYVATIPCANDGSHPATTVNATVTSSTATADCTTPNDTTYIATGFPAESGLALPADYADKVISGAIDENAHDWAAPVFTWADDLSSATATRTCINNAEHTEDADSVSVTSEVTTPATDVEPGEITYTATALFGEESFTDTRTKTIDPSETDYEFVEFEWADDNTAKVVVKDRNNGNVTVKFAVTVNSRSVDATCLSDAYTVYTVTYEDHTDTRTVYDEGTQLEHNFTVLQSDASGHWYKCETCSETTAKEDHTGGTATCSAKAVCEVCGTAYGSFASHDFSVVQSDASGHWFKCTNCDETTVKEAHTGGTATCLAKAQCEVCGTEYGRKVQHSFTNYVYDNNATCLTNGTETAVCDHGCGTTDTRTKVASATGHNFGEWTVTTPATCRAEGVETRVCQNDPSHTQIRAIPKTDHVDADGDTLCDVCGGPTADHQHSDVDGDGYCDTCNAKTDVHQHKDANGDNICDDCGKAIDTGFRCSFCNKNDKMQASNSSVAVKLVYRIIHFIIHMVQGIRFSV